MLGICFIKCDTVLIGTVLSGWVQVDQLSDLTAQRDHADPYKQGANATGHPWGWAIERRAEYCDALQRAQNDKKNWGANWQRYNAPYSMSQMHDSFELFLRAMTNGSKNIILRATHLLTQRKIQSNVQWPRFR